jgi:energy-coupling factor transport system permease protein
LKPARGSISIPPARPDGSEADRWRRTDPLTRLVISVATVIAAVLLGGVLCPLLLALGAVVVPAALAGVLRQVLRTGLLLALPLAISAAVVNVLFSVGGTVIAEVGPLQITEEGVALAAEVVARVLTMAGAVVLFYATTRPAELVGSLQYHGVSARLTFVIHNGVAMIPRLRERAAEVTAAQRARGLDTEGSVLRRGRGVLAVAAPTVLGAVREVETRTLALETRGFTRPGRHTVLWPPHDSGLQRLARWGVTAGLLLLALARVTGVLPC